MEPKNKDEKLDLDDEKQDEEIEKYIKEIEENDALDEQKKQQLIFMLKELNKKRPKSVNIIRKVLYIIKELFITLLSVSLSVGLFNMAISFNNTKIMVFFILLITILNLAYNLVVGVFVKTKIDFVVATLFEVFLFTILIDLSSKNTLYIFSSIGYIAGFYILLIVLKYVLDYIYIKLLLIYEMKRFRRIK